MSVSTPVISLAMRLERKLLIRKDSLAATYAKVHIPPPAPGSASIENLNDEELINLDQNLSKWHWLWRPIPIILYTATIAQIGLATLSVTVYNYRFM
jgi:hypothetical protein